MTVLFTGAGREIHLDGRDNGRSIHPLDLARGLSRMPRWSGHSLRLYTVAEHSIAVADLLESWCEPPPVQLEGLLHDATETYIGDLSSPAKRLCPGYQRLEAMLDGQIRRRFGLPADLSPAVLRADQVMLLSEARALMPAHPWVEERMAGWGITERDLVPVDRHTPHGIDWRDRWLRHFLGLWEASTA